MRIHSLILVGVATLTLVGCGRPKEPQCVAIELGNGVVSLQTPTKRGYTCTSQGAAAAMADYIGKRPELNVEVVAFNRRGTITTLMATPKTKGPTVQ